MNQLYFAYGSNMYTPRMRARAPSAVRVGTGFAEGWRLLCNKHGRDGSGKANLVRVPGRKVWGVLYSVRPSDLDRLDEVEQGYRRIALSILRSTQPALVAEAYISDRLTGEPVPYAWYRELMLLGARQHGLPESHIAYLQALPSRIG